MKFTHDLVSRHEKNWLSWLAEFKDKPTRILEVGSFEGRSIIWFFQNILTHPECRAVCVDTFQWLDARPTFEANVKEARIEDKIEVRQQSSMWLQLPGNSIDFAYCDGNHTKQRVLLDALLIWRSLKPNGILIFDDYLLDRNGEKQVKVACDAFLRVFADDLQVIAQGYQLCIRKMK